ncbi:MAG TPA: hypothetical protein DDW17_08155 [Deltaproteobacteria bacterium]|nr:hypothetical protein [Deltaproteobacteria bacterium]
MDEIAKIMVNEFKKQPDGSWVCIKNSDIVTKAGNMIRVSPGLTFKKDRRLWGLDVVKMLDELSTN